MQSTEIFAVVACVVRWKRLDAAFTYRARRFSPSINECARNAPKFGGAQTWKIFALENACTASRTWVGHEQRFLPQIYSLTYCNMI